MTATRQKLRLDQVMVPAGTPDGQVPTVAGGELTYAPGGGPGGGGSGTTALVPLTTVVAGEPVLVWEADNSLALTEVPR